MEYFLTMKKINFYIITSILFIQSCATSTEFYQVYTTVASEKIQRQNNRLVYEDELCKIEYDLWENGGNIGFTFYNKSTEKVYLNMEESFFIRNGIAHNYYKNRIFTNSSSKGYINTFGVANSKSVSGFNYLNLFQTNNRTYIGTTGISNSNEESVGIQEEKIVCIPPRTAKIINEYSVNTVPYRHCNLYMFPNIKDTSAAKFNLVNSPLVFSNRISYSLKKDSDFKEIEHSFYVSEIKNFPEEIIIDKKYDEYCGVKESETTNDVPIKIIKGASPFKFYIRYNNEQKNWVKIME